MADPEISNLDGDSVLFIEDGTGVLIDAGTAASVIDPDTEDFHGATLTISIAGALPEDFLFVGGVGEISAPPTTPPSVHYGNPVLTDFQIGEITSNGESGSDLVIQLKRSGFATHPEPITAEKVAALIHAIGYRNANAADPAGHDRQVTYTLTDPEGGTTSVTATVHVQPMNDAPTVAGPLSAPLIIDVSGIGGADSGEDFDAVLSADGRFAIFQSDTATLLPGLTPGRDHIFLKDLTTGAITLVTRGIGGLEANDLGRAQESDIGSISADGRYVVFSSGATNLVAGDLNGLTDVFRWDRLTGEIRLVTVTADGVQADAGTFVNEDDIRVTADGRFVVFVTQASNLVSGDVAGTDDVLVKDMLTGAVIRASVNAAGEPGVNINSEGQPSAPFYGSVDISDDGRYVAFDTQANNMVPGYDQGSRSSFSSDVYLKDLQTGTVYFVSESELHPGAAQGDDIFGSRFPNMSGDGRYVIFTAGPDVVPDNSNWWVLWDRATGEIRQFATSATGAVANSSVWEARISRSGEYVAFYSTATNLTPDAIEDGQVKVFVKNLVTGAIEYLGPPLRGEFVPWVSDDGKVVLYVASDDYAPGDTNGLDNVYAAYPTFGRSAGIPVIEDVPSPVKGITFDDIDAGSNPVTVTLSVPRGALAATSFGNVIVSNATGLSVTLTGPLADINAFLTGDRLLYTTVLNDAADVPITVRIDDNGHSGLNPGGGGGGFLAEASLAEEGGFGLFAEAEFNLDVIPVNDPPTLTNDGLTVTEGAGATIGSAQLAANDIDNADLELVYTVATATQHGILLKNGIPLGAGGTFTQDDIDNNRIGYLHDSSDTTTDGFSFVLRDGPDGQATERNFAITVIPVDDAPPGVNDAPVNTVPATREFEANVPAAIIGLAVADVDAGAGVITTTLALQFGILTLAANGGAAIANNGSGAVTLTGTLTQINAALAGSNVAYTAPLDFFGTDTLTMFTNDNGHSGSGGPLTDTDQVTIHLNTYLEGSDGDNGFSALPGNAMIVARLGHDTITFDFALTQATVTWRNNLVIIDGPSSHTVLSGFETFVFTDGTVHNADDDRLVDDLFYYSRNHELWQAQADADAHYHATGWREGRDPNAFFDTDLYLAINPDVRSAGIDPLVHFDQSGWREGRIASPNFDPAKYLAFYGDVAAADRDPLEHFLRHGAEENRLPFAANVPLAANGFDFAYYLLHNPDVAAAGVDPRVHFETIGWKEGRNPNALFDVNGYLAQYSDVAAAGINPLDHYHQSGWREGRDPSVDFDTGSYLASYPDVAAANRDPLAHYLQFGIHEGRSTFADGVWG